MDTHEQIDQRSLLLARAIVAKIDKESSHAGLTKAQAVCRKWALKSPEPVVQQWAKILLQPWETIRHVLLDDSQEARRLRQSNPFCGILTPQERWNIYREFEADETHRS